MQPFNKKLFSKVLDIFDEHYNQAMKQSGPLAYYRSAQDLSKHLDLTINATGKSEEEVIEDIKTYLKYSTNTQHPHFFNQLFSASFPMAQVGELVATMTNSTSATYEAAPVATQYEKTLIKNMCSLIGFTQGGGTFVSGGSQANLVGILCARHQQLPEIKLHGYPHNASLVMFTSDQAHYSLLNAANVLGLGTANVVLIPTDKQGRMSVVLLESLIQQSLQNNKKPFLVVATAGTTVQGAFDPLGEIAQVTNRYKLWLHVDACLGGSVALSPTYKSLLSGIELADSVAWDPHKLMGLPLYCSVILVKKKSHLSDACTSSHNDYLFHDEQDNIDLGRASLQCARRLDTLKLWFTWRYLGDNGFAAHIDNLFEMARYLEAKVIQSVTLELMVSRQSLSVCFRYRFPSGIDSNSFNRKLRDTLYKQGKSFINFAYLQQQLVLRVTLTNPFLTEADMDILINHIEEQGRQLENLSMHQEQIN